MDTHLNDELLDRMRRQEASPAELLPALRHLSTCPECQARSSKSIRPVEPDLLLGPTGEVLHLDAGEQLIPYVDRALSPADIEIVETHLESCEECRADVADLEAFRARTGRRAKRRRMFLACAAAAATLAGVLLFTRSIDPVAPRTIPRGSIATRPAPRAVPSTPIARRYPHPEWAQLVETARATGRLAYPAFLDALAPNAEQVRSGSSATGDARLAPAGVVVESTQPRLTWSARPGATYRVVIFRDEERVEASPALSTPAWTPPTALARGHTYAWQVEATRGNQIEILPSAPAPPALFHIVSERDHAEIAEALRRFPDDSWLHAVLYARAGLRDQAEAARSRASAR